ASALHRWCDQSGQKMYVVTGDEDWTGLCSDGGPLILRSRIIELLEEFTDSLVSPSIKDALVEHDDLKGRIFVEFTLLDFYSPDRPNLNVEDFDFIEVKVETAHILEAKDGEATASIDCLIDFSLTITPDDVETNTFGSEVKLLYGDRISKI